MRDSQCWRCGNYTENMECLCNLCLKARANVTRARENNEIHNQTIRDLSTLCTDIPINSKQKQTKGKRDLSLAPTYWLDIAVGPLIIGQEKGYTAYSWLLPGTKRSVWLTALKRHMIALEAGNVNDDGDYVEYKLDGSECETIANHYEAIAFNALALATSRYLGRDEENDIGIDYE